MLYDRIKKRIVSLRYTNLVRVLSSPLGETGVGLLNSCEASIVVDNNNHRMAGSSIEQEPESADIAMYPNPAENSIVITGVNGKAKVEVYSIMGQLILIKDIESDKETIDLSALNNGTYLVKITSDAQTLKTDRLIIIK